MDWITEDVAIGNRIDAHDRQLIEANGFKGVVSLDGSMSSKDAIALGYDDWVGATLIDGYGNDPEAFRKIVLSLVDMVEGSPPVLVHCHAGRSRSVTVVAGYLVLTKGLTPQAAYALVATKRETAVQAGLPDLLNKLR